MKSLFSLSMCILLLLQSGSAFSQQIKFNRVLNNTNNWSDITGIAQDHEGYIWFSSQSGGLCRYDGSRLISYVNDPRNPNSLAGNYTECLFIDSSDIIWIGTIGSGLDRFDKTTNMFTHFRHDSKDRSSLNNDTVTAILKDHEGNLWIGNYSGLDLLDEKTGKFTHYTNKLNEPSSLSNNHVRVVYEDHQGTLWVGCGSPYIGYPGEGEKDGGLNRFDRATGKFTRYLHDANNPNSLENNKVWVIFEDSKGNFWIGTAGDGLHTMDRDKGIFTHYYYDASHPEKLSRPPLYNALNKTEPLDYITFITEDFTGAIWIGSFLEGINRYDPDTKKITHYGLIIQNEKIISERDTLTGFNDNTNTAYCAFSSKDSLLWIGTLGGNLYNVNPFKTTIPYYTISDWANSFYKEPNGDILWIATTKGLIRKDLNNQNQKIWRQDPLNANSRSNNINAMRVDEEGKFWLATVGGLCKFDPRTNTFTTYQHNEKKPDGLSTNLLTNLCIDQAKNLWVATAFAGVDKMNSTTGVFTNYRHDSKDSNSLSNNFVSSIAEDRSNEMWFGTERGLNRLNNKNGKFHHYLANSFIKNICIDANGIVWAGANEGLYYFNSRKNEFLLFADPNSHQVISGVFHILEDNKKNLWVSTTNAIVKINDKRDSVKRFGENYGVHRNDFNGADNFKAKNGELFLGDQSGYYAFFPDELKDNSRPPQVNFTSFKLNDQEVIPTRGSVLNVPIWLAKEIKLNYQQNDFSFDFTSIHFTNPGEEKYLFMLENYDNTWHNIGTDHKAYFFNVPPGTYIFYAKAVNSDGSWGEKEIRIIITPPWWRTWWAYTIFVLLFVTAIWGFIYYRSRQLRRENRILEEKVTHRTALLNQSLEHLKATQKQLIQSEKMASLGELTAGIAHEIQNPLNFVNNFSEVSNELITEMDEELDKGDIKEAKLIAADIKQNLEKINHHGKRADSIVKGMLEHSKASTGKKELTDINKLADEYLRLSYHGFRAKDKSFNAVIKTGFDETIGKINVVPQDIGRVLLNLFNNAFYAASLPSKGGFSDSDNKKQPTVTISTSKNPLSGAGGLRF